MKSVKILVLFNFSASLHRHKKKVFADKLTELPDLFKFLRQAQKTTLKHELERKFDSLCHSEGYAALVYFNVFISVKSKFEVRITRLADIWEIEKKMQKKLVMHDKNRSFHFKNDENSTFIYFHCIFWYFPRDSRFFREMHH